MYLKRLWLVVWPQLVSFFYSTSHKTIGILYLMFGIRGGIAGSACSGIIRIE